MQTKLSGLQILTFNNVFTKARRLSWFPSSICILKQKIERFFVVFNNNIKRLINMKNKYSRMSRHEENDNLGVYF